MHSCNYLFVLHNQQLRVDEGELVWVRREGGYDLSLILFLHGAYLEQFTV